MELDWLETFLAVVDRGGFTAASEHVHRSQSRVSAHIAALERELGTRLIDRARRPAAPTPAGEVFARHAREIVAGIGSARSAVGALRTMAADALTAITTPTISSSLFPGVLSGVLAEHPDVRVSLVEDHRHDLEQRFSADGAVLAVLPTLDHPLPPGLQERVLWRDPLKVVVAPRHELARSGSGAVDPAALAAQPLLVANGTPDVIGLLADRGVAAAAQVAADDPATIVALARAGLGVGVLGGVGVACTDTTGVVVLDIGDADFVGEVAAYWYDVLVSVPVGKALLRSVLGAQVPAGGLPPGRR